METPNDKKNSGKSAVHQKNKKLKQNQNQNQSDGTELRLLKISFNRIMRTRTFGCLKKPDQATIGLTGIAKKFDNYASSDEFMDDIAVLVRSYSAKATKNVNVKEAIDSLLDLCRHDIKCIQTCAECFEYLISGDKDYFARACSKPHLLVYARIPRFPNWPAKVMTMNDTTANLQFFGDHTQADVLLEDCFLYSNRFTAKNLMDRKLNVAIKELERYIENLKKKCGSFVPAPFKVGLNVKSLEQNLKTMFPSVYTDEASGNEDDQSMASVENEENAENIVDFPVEMLPMDMPLFDSSLDHEIGDTGEKSPNEPDEQDEAVVAKRIRISEFVKAFGGKTKSFDANKENIALNDGKRKSALKKPTERSVETARVVEAQTKTKIDEIDQKICVLEEHKKNLEQQLTQLKEKKNQIKEQVQKNQQEIWNLKYEMVIAKSEINASSSVTLTSVIAPTLDGSS